MTARMIPSRYLADYKSGGEELVFETLKNNAPESWIVLHSLDIAPSDERRRGEADFVVIVPDLGVAVLEVKSVAKQEADGTWNLGGAARTQRSPFVQADGAMRSILSYLEKSRLARRPFLCSGVVTPFGDITTEARGNTTIEWNTWQAIGRSCVKSLGLVQAIERLIQMERESEGFAGREFDSRQVLDALRPRFEFYVSPAARRERREEEIKRYTEEQYDTLDDYAANGQLLVMGPAGCGKTLLALELARRSVETEQNVLLVCYNRLLAGWLQSQAKPLGYLATASSLDSFMLDITGLKPDRNAGPEFWTSELPLTAAARFASDHHPFDVLIVDEAQDLLTEAHLMLLDECLSGGLARGRWVFFGDFENQQVNPLTRNQDAAAQLERACGSRVFTRRLRRNCRNTQHIAHLAEEVASFPAGLGYSSCLRPDQGAPPTIVALGEADDAETALAAALDDLKTAGFSPDEVAVLSGCSSEASTAARLAVADRWRDILRPSRNIQRGKIRFDSVRRFKGLEAPAVVLTDLACTPSEDLSDLVYVGATRSVDTLVIIAEKSAISRLGLRSNAHISKERGIERPLTGA